MPCVESADDKIEQAVVEVDLSTESMFTAQESLAEEDQQQLDLVQNPQSSSSSSSTGSTAPGSQEADPARLGSSGRLRWSGGSCSSLRGSVPPESRGANYRHVLFKTQFTVLSPLVEGYRGKLSGQATCCS